MAGQLHIHKLRSTLECVVELTWPERTPYVSWALTQRKLLLFILAIVFHHLDQLEVAVARVETLLALDANGDLEAVLRRVYVVVARVDVDGLG